MKVHYFPDDIVEICNMKHLTVDDIHSELVRLWKDLWKSSVYRNCDELVEQWKLKKIVWVWKKTYYEKNVWNHIHLVDEKSWKIVDLNVKELVLPKLPENFSVNNLDIKIYWEFK